MRGGMFVWLSACMGSAEGGAQYNDVLLPPQGNLGSSAPCRVGGGAVEGLPGRRGVYALIGERLVCRSVSLCIAGGAGVVGPTATPPAVVMVEGRGDVGDIGCSCGEL